MNKREELITKSPVTLPNAVIEMITHEKPADTCRRCLAFDGGVCMSHGYRVKEDAVICDFFDPAY